MPRRWSGRSRVRSPRCLLSKVRVLVIRRCGPRAGPQALAHRVYVVNVSPVSVSVNGKRLGSSAPAAAAGSARKGPLRQNGRTENGGPMSDAVQLGGESRQPLTRDLIVQEAIAA